MEQKRRYIWLTDLHLDLAMPWTIIKFILHLRKENPAGIFLTGDISNGLLTPFHLRLIATFVRCPIYFVMGNHDRYFSSLAKSDQKIRKLCQKYPNLIWMDDQEVIPLNKETAIIGVEGWYDCKNGNPNLLRLTSDWFMITDFRELPNMNARIEMWKQIAQQSAEKVVEKLNKAIEQGYKTIYLLTHFPPFVEANRNVGGWLHNYWVPYDCNIVMGDALKEVMAEHKKKHLTIYSGHIHKPITIQVSRNILCCVGDAHYIGLFNLEENLIII